MTRNTTTARHVEAVTNPTVAAFVVAELAEHRDRVQAEANGSLLIGPRMNLVQAHIHQLCELHGLTPPTAGPSGDHTPGGPA